MKKLLHSSTWQKLGWGGVIQDPKRQASLAQQKATKTKIVVLPLSYSRLLEGGGWNVIVFKNIT